MVHYVISSRSVEATKDMTETLMQNLIKANKTIRQIGFAC